MREACAIQPCLFIESNRVNQQGISLPPSDRIAHPCGIQILGMFVGARCINLPDEVVEFEQLNYAAGDLKNFHGERVHIDSRHARWETSDFISSCWIDRIG